MTACPILVDAWSWRNRRWATSARQAVIYLAGLAREVTLHVRGGSFTSTMSHKLVERIERSPNIQVRDERQIDLLRGCCFT